MTADGEDRVAWDAVAIPNGLDSHPPADPPVVYNIGGLELPSRSIPHA